MEPTPSEVFVYGTLLPGQVNYQHIASMVSSSSTAKTRGRLFHLPYGYPAMQATGEGWVRGELLSFKVPVERALEVCDVIEGYMPEDEEASLFIRVVRPVEPESSKARHAWCYCLAPEWEKALLKIGREIDDGDWLAFIHRRARQKPSG